MNKIVKSVKHLVEIALENPNDYGEMIFSKLPIKQARLIEAFIGVNLVGTERIMETSAIRHTIKNHGSPIKEALRGQIAVTIDDFLKVPLILREPDKISYLGKNSAMQDVFLFTKQIGVIYMVAECVRFSKIGDRMVFCTMYKKKTKKPTL